MKNVRRFFFASLVVLAAWVTRTAAAQELVTFPDQNLEMAVRAAVAKPVGELTQADLAKLDSLSAGGLNIVSLSGLEGGTNLTNLDLAGNAISNLLPLAGLDRLVQLNLDRNRIGDLSPLAGLFNLVTLDVSENQITDASVLEGLTNVCSLRLYRNAIVDCSFASGESQLRLLDLEDNQISDLSPLTGLTNLSSLALGGNPITNLSSLSRLPMLAKLSLRNVGIDNLAALKDLNQLRHLNLERNRIKDLSPLASIADLRYLNLRWNQITNYSDVLSGFTNLTTLYFGGNSISNIESLKNLNRLTFLNLSENAVTDLTPIANLTNLDYLVLSGNPISDYTVLSELTKIVNLELRGNTISNFNFLSKLGQLGYLDIAYNRINDLRPLALLTNLHSVVLDENRLTNYTELSMMSSLSNLWLAGNLIDDVSYLTNLTQLNCLNLNDNVIADPSPLSALTNLTSMALSRNLMAGYEGLAGLTNLTSLELNGDSIGNLNFLSGLIRLKNLELQNNQLTDLDALSGPTNLVTFFADYNRLTNIAGLRNLPRLSRVQLVGNPLEVRIEAIATNITDLQLRGVDVIYLPTNQPPNVWLSTNWFIAVNESSSLGFYLSDDVTTSDRLLITSTSSNPELIPDASITLSGTNGSRTLIVTPSFDKTGLAVITLKVSDAAGVNTMASVQVAVLVPQPVPIPDQNLDAIVRSTLNKPTGSLTSVDLLGLTDLFIFDSDVASLSGLEWATNLTTLYLASTSITNVDSLQFLPNLNSLSLDGTPLADYSALAGFTNLAFLRLADQAVGDLTFLQDLTQLTGLDLLNTRLTDITPLSVLTNLALLNLEQNRLVDVSSLTNLFKLSFIDLQLNLLETSTNTILQQLQDRGASVFYQPQRASPIFITPDKWFSMENSVSYQRFSVLNDGPSSEQLAVTFSSSTGNLVAGTNLILNRDSPGLKPDWILTVTPPTNYIGTSGITLIVSNEVGLSAAMTVDLTVAAPLPLDDQLLDQTNLAWVSGGASPWFGQDNISHAGGSAAQSGSITDYQESWLETIVQGPGVLSFWWKVSSEPQYDWFEFYIDGQLQDRRISGEVDWELVTANIPPGPRTIKWRYIKDEDASHGLDAAWLDQISFTPLSWLQLLESPTGGQCQLLLHPVQGKQYILETSMNLTDWFTLSVVVTTNSIMPFADTTSSTTMRFYRLKELFASSIWLQNPSRSGNEFQVELHSPPGLRFEMQASTDLANWSGLITITNTSGAVTYTNEDPANLPVRFYRARLLP